MTHEHEIIEPVDLCDARGRLNSAARGWSRHPLHRANLRRAWLRKKRWDYWCVIDDQVAVALTYADVDYLGLATMWVLDRGSGQTASADVVSPGGWNIGLPNQPCTGTMRWSSRRLRLEIVETRSATLLRAVAPKSGEPLEVDLVVERPVEHESMNVVIPWSGKRFQFTSKQNSRPVTGTVRMGERRFSLGPDTGAFGVLDLGRGIWPYRNRWNWAAASGRSIDGVLVGLQFGGKWTEGTGFTENALCLDGHLTKIGEELEWTYDWDDPMRPWHVRTPGSCQVDVTLTPTYDRHGRMSLGVLSMEVHQCFGTWSGTVRDAAGRTHTLAGISGFAEEARNRW